MKYEPIISRHTLELVRANLSRYWTHAAARLARDVGFSFVAVPDAPSDFAAIKAAARRSLTERKPFPVWDGGCENILFTSATANHAFRFVHDLTHYAKGYEFTPSGEQLTAQTHLDDIARVFGRDSLEWWLTYADTIGQVLHNMQTGGGFVADQLAFDLEFIGVKVQ